MRIVIVSTGAPPDPFGGIGTYIEGLLGGLTAHDAEVHLVGASRHPHLPRVFRHQGATVRRVLVTPPWARTSLPRSRIGMMAVVARLNLVGAWYAWRLHARGKVDLVAVHDWMCAPAGLVCAVLFRIPVCYHVHSAEIFLRDRGRGPVSALGRALNRALSRRARLIMVPSPHTAAGIPHLAGRSDVAVVSHGAGKAWRMTCPDDVERAAVRDKVRALYGIQDDQPMIMFAGRYGPHKGVTELIETVRRMRAGGTDVTLVMAGTGWPDDTAIDQRLRERVAEAGLAGRVHVLGRYLDTDELRDHVVAADACVFPSTSESFGFAALEAMALRARAVVGPGFDPEVVGSAEGACVRTATLDPDELADALLRVLGDDDPGLGDRARRYVLGRHSWDTAATRTLRAYAEAVRR
ncbi:glycosyltransferase family 4 protein [Nonomuraea sp. MG754425]|uniref:glycosyltransferase family 4 protein n=1 Tax=Nonomuraea sp. MG754425 TaxID=2570319 RepID=UPI001F1CC341|nr:glycosyltransferase family 4 protein [Nonomuraea sp. MG754425]